MLLLFIEELFFIFTNRKSILATPLSKILLTILIEKGLFQVNFRRKNKFNFIRYCQEIKGIQIFFISNIYLQKCWKMVPQSEAGSTNAQTQLAEMKPNDLFIHDFGISLSSPIYSTAYISDDAFICLGGGDGFIRVLSNTSKKIAYNLCQEDKSPISCLAATSQISGIKNSVMATHASGTLEFWHATSSQLLFQKKYDNFLQCCEVSPDGEWYVIGGQNGEMFLGHLNKGQPKTLETGHLGSHSNRVFCIKWHPDDPNVFLSGGWDKTVFFWDRRTKMTINKIFGSYIGGKAIDIKGNDYLLGNNENNQHLRVYDMKGDKMRVINWQHYSDVSFQGKTGINSCIFGKADQEVVALSSRNELRSFIENSCVSLFEHIELNNKGYSMSSSTKSRSVVTSWSNGDVQVMSY